MAALQAALTAIQSVVRDIPGIVSVPAQPPEQLTVSDLPVAIIFPVNGGWRWGAMSGASSERPMLWGVHTIAVDLWLARSDLGVNAADAMGYAVQLPNALMKAFVIHRVTGSLTTLGFPGSATDPIRYTLGSGRWGGLDVIGYQFQIDIAVEQEIS